MRYPSASRVAGILATVLVVSLAAGGAEAKKSGTEVRNEQPPSGRGPGSDDRRSGSGGSGRDEGSSGKGSGSGHSGGSSSGSNSGSENHGGDDAVSSHLDSVSSGKGRRGSGSSHGLPSGSKSTTNSGPGSKATVVVISDEDRL